MGFNNIVNTAIDRLKKTIWDMDHKTRGIYVNWLDRHIKYLQNESSFSPSDHVTYKRGMVVHVDFGFRVDAEYGGFHWAVIVQNDNKAARTVVVVPLSSVKKGQTTHRNDADLGRIIGLNENRAEGLLGQITTISKMRIKIGTIYTLNDAQLDEVDRKLIVRYTGPKYKKKLLKDNS